MSLSETLTIAISIKNVQVDVNGKAHNEMEARGWKSLLYFIGKSFKSQKLSPTLSKNRLFISHCGFPIDRKTQRMAVDGSHFPFSCAILNNKCDNKNRAERERGEWNAKST